MTGRRRAALLPLLALVAPWAGLAGCAAGDEAPPPPKEYVALGDSYTAAPLTGPLDGPSGCVRSSTNYPHLLAEAADLTLTDVSCASATTEAVRGVQYIYGTPMPPQLDAVTEDTDLVTIGLGLNDFGLTSWMFGNCQQLALSYPFAAPCTAADQAAGDLRSQVSLAQIPARITAVVDAVRERAPDARIVLVGYPTIFPDEGSCPALGMAAADIPFVRGLVDSVNASLAGVAEASDTDYLDVATATEGHDICADDPWIKGLVSEPDRDALAWHPYTEEQEVVADLLTDLIT